VERERGRSERRGEEEGRGGSVSRREGVLADGEGVAEQRRRWSVGGEWGGRAGGLDREGGGLTGAWSRPILSAGDCRPVWEPSGWWARVLRQPRLGGSRAGRYAALT
jgi:hypothetical protein